LLLILAKEVLRVKSSNNELVNLITNNKHGIHNLNNNNNNPNNKDNEITNLTNNNNKITNLTNNENNEMFDSTSKPSNSNEVYLGSDNNNHGEN
jgi:hypothetical protein